MSSVSITNVRDESQGGRVETWKTPWMAQREKMASAPSAAAKAARAAKLAADEGRGLGETVGREIARRKLRFHSNSILATAFAHDSPATVHVTLGADIIHMHLSADGAAIGKAKLADFLKLAAVVSELSRGVVINLGSAVTMPEVFTKALNLARNLGRKVEKITAADMDFIRHYRPRVNVLERPTAGGGKAIALTGHHEIMFPLLIAMVREAMARR